MIRTLAEYLIFNLQTYADSSQAIKHNNQIPHNRKLYNLLLCSTSLTSIPDFRKDWQRRVRVHFDQVIPLSGL